MSFITPIIAEEEMFMGERDVAVLELNNFDVFFYEYLKSKTTIEDLENLIVVYDGVDNLFDYIKSAILSHIRLINKNDTYNYNLLITLTIIYIKVYYIVYSTHFYSEDSLQDEICSICLGDLKNNICHIKQCGHSFCRPCFFNWLDRNFTCPICRGPV